MDTKGCNVAVCLYEATEALRLGLYDDAEDHVWNAIEAHKRFEKSYNHLLTLLRDYEDKYGT